MSLDRGKYFISSKSISEKYDNSWRVWQEMGRPHFPSQRQVETLKQSAIPLFESSQEKVQDSGLQLAFTLPKMKLN